MSCYLYDFEGKQLTFSTSASRAVLALVEPFRARAERAFREVEELRLDLERQMLAGAQPSFGEVELAAPLDGQDGILGAAFVMAVRELPRELDRACAERMRRMGLEDENLGALFSNALDFIDRHAIVGGDVLIR